jgi:hypothetical protein
LADLGDFLVDLRIIYSYGVRLSFLIYKMEKIIELFYS